MEKESHHVDADNPVGPDSSGSSGEFKPSAKLRARIDNLAHWRIDPSIIKFWRYSSESHGGHATVLGSEIGPTEIETRDLEKCALDKKLDGPDMEAFVSWRNRFRRWTSFIAVKRMRLADDTDFERVLGLALREVEFLAELDHENIVELEGFVEDVSKGIIWLVFPFATFGNLKEFIALENWELPERISLISDVAQGLEYLHNRNPPICHGDLKSLNVLTYYGDFPGENQVSAVITDFGSARRLPQGNTNMRIEEVERQPQPAQTANATFCASTNTITLTGNKYTLRWAAPELLIDDQLSLWSDIWALGWVAYEVMTKSLPFEDIVSEVDVVERVVEGNYHQ